MDWIKSVRASVLLVLVKLRQGMGPRNDTGLLLGTTRKAIEQYDVATERMFAMFHVKLD